MHELDRDGLIRLIIKRAESDPDLVGWIEAELATAPRRGRKTLVDARPLAAQALSFLAGRYRRRRYWDDYRSSGDIAELQTLVEKAVPFLEAGDGRKRFGSSAARTAFEHTLSFADFSATKSWAGENWKTIRQDLLGCLMNARYAPDRTEILLSEGLVDDAVRCIGDGEADATSDAVLMRLMDTACATHPDWAIRLAERKAARIMDAGASASYDLAAEWLKRAALAYDAAGKIDDWTATIEALIDRHRRKYGLRPLLEALRHGFSPDHYPK